MRKKMKGNDKKKRKHQKIGWQKEEENQLLVKMCRNCTKKEEEKQQNGRGVRIGRIFLVCFSRGDDKKLMKTNKPQNACARGENSKIKNCRAPSENIFKPLCGQVP